MDRSSLRRIDVYEAVKYDMRLHGFRFIFLEFLLVGLGALALMAVEFVHAANGMASLLGGIWFFGVSLNCLTVTTLALQARRHGVGSNLSDRRVHLYALELINTTVAAHRNSASFSTWLVRRASRCRHLRAWSFCCFALQEISWKPRP